MKHSHKPNDEELTPSVLATIARRDGASELFQAVLLTDAPDGARHLARYHVRKAVRHDREMPCAWGHFMSAIWQGDWHKAVARADYVNASILKDSREVRLWTYQKSYLKTGGPTVSEFPATWYVPTDMSSNKTVDAPRDVSVPWEKWDSFKETNMSENKNTNAVDASEIEHKYTVSASTIRRIVIKAQHIKEPTGGRTAGKPLAR